MLLRTMPSDSLRSFFGAWLPLFLPVLDRVGKSPLAEFLRLYASSFSTLAKALSYARDRPPKRRITLLAKLTEEKLPQVLRKTASWPSWDRRQSSAEAVVDRLDRFALVVLFLAFFMLFGCQDLVPRDTSSLLLPRFQRSEIFGFVAGFGTTFAAVPDLAAMLKRRSSARVPA